MAAVLPLEELRVHADVEAVRRLAAARAGQAVRERLHDHRVVEIKVRACVEPHPLLGVADGVHHRLQRIVEE
ncbi:MAG: hypothetical protein ACK56F_28940, partial [bacterium]